MQTQTNKHAKKQYQLSLSQLITIPCSYLNSVSCFTQQNEVENFEVSKNKHKIEYISVA